MNPDSTGSFVLLGHHRAAGWRVLRYNPVYGQTRRRYPASRPSRLPAPDRRHQRQDCGDSQRPRGEGNRQRPSDRHQAPHQRRWPEANSSGAACSLGGVQEAGGTGEAQAAVVGCRSGGNCRGDEPAVGSGACSEGIGCSHRSADGWRVNGATAWTPHDGQLGLRFGSLA
jgi:hypothetical protein